MALTDNLIAYWKFNSNANDEQGNHNGVGYGGIDLSSTGKFGQAVEFDGVNDNIHMGNPAGIMNISGDITIAWWMYMPANAAGGTIMRSKHYSNFAFSHTPLGSANAGIGFWYYHNQTFSAAREARTTQSSHASTGYGDAWHHFAFTRDYSTGKITLYIDGVDDTNPAVNNSGQGIVNDSAGGYNDGIDKVTVGSSHSTGSPNGDYWTPNDTKFDDMAIWDRVLSLAELQDIVTRGEAGQTLLETASPVDGSGISITVV